MAASGNGVAFHRLSFYAAELQFRVVGCWGCSRFRCLHKLGPKRWSWSRRLVPSDPKVTQRRDLVLIGSCRGILSCTLVALGYKFLFEQAQGLLGLR